MSSINRHQRVVPAIDQNTKSGNAPERAKSPRPTLTNTDFSFIISEYRARQLFLQVLVCENHKQTEVSGLEQELSGRRRGQTGDQYIALRKKLSERFLIGRRVIRHRDRAFSTENEDILSRIQESLRVTYRLRRQSRG